MEGKGAVALSDCESLLFKSLLFKTHGGFKFA